MSLATTYPGTERLVKGLASAVTGTLDHVNTLNTEAEMRWAGRLHIERALTRAMVSFQANKDKPVYRWFKFKEAFSVGLVEYLLDRYGVRTGRILDPFAGSGTALFAGAGLGLDAEGIELLPIGQTIISARQCINCGTTSDGIARLICWRDTKPWKKARSRCPVSDLRITRGAYPSETLDEMGKFLSLLGQESQWVRAILQFAILCVLESVSYTRKDGQYLRWDHRAGRGFGKKIFDKGRVVGFDEAIARKLDEIIHDLSADQGAGDLFTSVSPQAPITLHAGSCLGVLPQLEADRYDGLITSPPYCNRYDYTRTYALELALLGVDEKQLVALRQDMLSCTVENRAKDLLAINARWDVAVQAADRHVLLQGLLEYLDTQRKNNVLNNSGIPRMVKGYFYEMACVIFEAARVLKPGAPLIMVNDNVRYAGAVISVDIILSEIAEQLGFVAERILVLPSGKGNSSQQMGTHGRESLRKCVYVWRKAPR
jgi:DNA modification methylase